MTPTKKILAIIGSVKANSSHLKLIKKLEVLMPNKYEISVFEKINELPHFNPDLDSENPPTAIAAFRQLILNADALIICTPEYIFSLPGSLKNAIEWCVSTTVFSQKPIGLITASASGEKAHEELKLIMRTVETKFTEETTLLIKGIKGKFNEQGILIDTETIEKLTIFINALVNQINA